MAVAKRNIEEIGESIENMGKNDRPSLLNTEVARAKRKKTHLKGGRKRKKLLDCRRKTHQNKCSNIS